MKAIEISSAKRSKNERMGLHSWHSYYAGYSEAVVEDILEYFNIDKTCRVLDPWMGSGTTAIVCQKKNVPVIGREINPVMVNYANGKIAKLLDFDLEAISEQIIENSLNTMPIHNNAIPEIITKEVIDKDYYLKLKSIEKSSTNIINNLPYSFTIKKILLDFYYSAIFQIIRNVGKFEKGTNPTWIKRLRLNKSQELNIGELFNRTVQIMFNDLQESYKGVNRENIPDIRLGNSKSLNLSDNSIDFIITSPPYLTRIDYVISTKPELLFLGLDEKDTINFLRKETMGAPVIRQLTPIINKRWGETCIKFLVMVKHHNSKAANSYYLKNFLQYFDDAFKSLQEIKRVLNSGGKATLVVQTSYFKEIEIQLTNIYIEMGKSLGLKSSILKREIIKQHMAYINTKSSQYVPNKLFYEDIILYQKE